MDIQRIIDNTVVDSDGCWIWDKSIASPGYGQLTENGKYWTTHRYSYTCIHGSVPDGLVVRHLCHKPACCNPEHLVIGTHRDNYYDSIVVHKRASASISKEWIIDGIVYNSCREAKEATSLPFSTLVKYTDMETRVFNIELYRYNCHLHLKIPKV